MGKFVGNKDRAQNLQLWLETVAMYYGIETSKEFVDRYSTYENAPDRWTIWGWLGQQKENGITRNISKAKLKSVGQFLHEVTAGDFDEYILDLRHDIFLEVVGAKKYKLQRDASEYHGGLTGQHVIYKPSFQYRDKYCREILEVRDDGSFSCYYRRHKQGRAVVTEFKGIVSERQHYYILPGFSHEGTLARERVIYFSRKPDHALFHQFEFGVVASSSPFHQNDLVTCPCVSFRSTEAMTLTEQILDNNVIYLPPRGINLGDGMNSVFKLLENQLRGAQTPSLGNGVIHINPTILSPLLSELSDLNNYPLITQIRKQNPTVILTRKQAIDRIRRKNK